MFMGKSLYLAATVNGQLITRLSVIKELEKQSGKKVLDNMITQSLIMEEARKKNIKINSQDIDKQMKGIEESVKKQGQNIDQLLAAQGMTKVDLRNQINVQMIIEKALASKIKVTDKDIDTYLKDNKAQFSQAGGGEPSRDQVKKQLQRKNYKKFLKNQIQ